MEVIQEQYKDTKIGRIPRDWEVINLIDATEDGISNGVFNDPKKVGKGYKLVNVVNMYRGNSIQIEDLTLLDLSSDEFEKNQVKYGDILFTRSSLVESGIAYSNINLSQDDDITYDGHLMKISPNKKLTNVIYLSYFFRGNSSRKQFIARGKTTTMTTIGQKDIASVKIAVPSIQEQQKIADILSTVDEQISTTQSIIDKSKELKKGLMQKLFSEGIGHTEFKDTKIGRIPKDWEIGKLGEHCVKATKKFEPSTSNDSHKYIGLEHIISNAHRINGYGDSNDTLSTKTIFTEGEILYGKLRPYLNKVWRAKFNGVCTTEILVLKSKNEFDNGFLFYLLHSHRFIGHTISHTEGTSLPRANWKDISIFKIPLPSLSEQQKIADILSEADKKIEKEEQEKAHLEQLKKGLMQQLLTGQKRVA